MSRTIMRVPLDFEHDGVWPGFQADEQYEPPPGDGWQIWETVSQGSPISPVFADKEDLAQWLVADEDHDCCIEAARAFIEDGYAPSMIGSGFGIHFGYQLAAGLATHLEYLERKAGDQVHVSGTRVRHLSAGITGAIEHIIPKECVAGTDDRYYLVTWDRSLPSLLEPGDDPARPMTSACRFDGFEVSSEPSSRPNGDRRDSE